MSKVTQISPSAGEFSRDGEDTPRLSEESKARCILCVLLAGIFAY